MIMMGQAIGTRQIRVRVSDTVCQEIVRMGKGRTTYVVTHEEYHQLLQTGKTIGKHI